MIHSQAEPEKGRYKFIYGPVYSWRLGRSLGIDPLSGPKKICTFDCSYCQLGRTGIFTAERKDYVTTGLIIEELHRLPALELDYLTFSGRGEPTLARNLGEMIRKIRQIRSDKIAVITNASLIGREDVQEDLRQADLVEAKLDASSPEVFHEVNRPMKGISFPSLVGSIRRFREIYEGKLALQIMFVRANRDHSREIAEMAREIGPDEIHLNTPLRQSRAAPLSRADMAMVKDHFAGLKCLSVYEVRKKAVAAISMKDTLKRRGRNDDTDSFK